MDALAEWNAAAMRAPRPGFLDAVRAAGATFGDAPVCVHRTPLLLEPAAVRVWQRVLPRMHRILSGVRASLLADLHRGPDSLAARIGLSAQAIEWAAIDPGFAAVAPLARLDAYVVDGVPHFLELNAESPAGMGYAAALAPIFQADPAAAALGPLGFLNPVPRVIGTVRSLAREWAQARRRGPEDPLMRNDRRLSVGIVDLPGVATGPEFRLLADAFTRAGLPAIVTTPQELRFDGDRLFAGGQPLDVVFRRLLVADLVAAPETRGALLEAYRAGRVCMINSLRTVLLHTKAIFALVHDPRFPLSAADRRFVRRHVPLTLRLDDAARERVRRAPEDWVLKPAQSHGGKGVVLGWAVGRAAWERAVDAADDAVVQARVRAPHDAFLDARDGQVHQRVVDIGPFLARGRLAGFLCRVAEGELANVSAGGASQVPVFSLSRRS